MSKLNNIIETILRDRMENFFSILSNIRTFENAGINIYHMNDFLEIINVIWDEHDFYSYFKNIGDKIKYQ